METTLNTTSHTTTLRRRSLLAAAGIIIALICSMILSNDVEAGIGQLRQNLTREVQPANS